MEHVLFVIIYAATLNSHKLFGLGNFVFCLMAKTKHLCTLMTRIPAAVYIYAQVRTRHFEISVCLQLETAGPEHLKMGPDAIEESYGGGFNIVTLGHSSPTMNHKKMFELNCMTFKSQIN